MKIYKYIVGAIIGALIGLVAFYILNFFILDKVYVAKAKAFVSVNLNPHEVEMGYNELRGSIELTASYMNYVKEHHIIHDFVLSNLPQGLSREYSVSEFDKISKVRFIDGTYLLEFSVESTNEEDAILLVNSFVPYSLKEIKSLLELGEVAIFELADGTQLKPLSKRALLISSIVTGLLTIASIFLYNYFKTSYANRKELGKAFPCFIRFVIYM